MSDESPFYAPDHKTPKRQPKPGELLFEFHVERTHKFFRAELRDHGEWGIEAQIIEAPDRLYIAHRFDLFHFPGCDCRRLAIQWAEEMRTDMITGRFCD